MKIYTDGATSNNGYAGARGGWAYVLIDENEQVVAHGMGYYLNATNNICELLAIINACKAVGDKPGPHTVYSDSSYCINCYKQQWYKKWIKNGWINSSNRPVANRDLWEELIPYFENSNFDFQKVKGHASDEWNNYVDKMAVQAKDLGILK